MYKIVLGSEWNENHATKNQANFQGPFLAPSAEGINPKCRLGQEKQKELMGQHVWDLFILPGHLKLFENNRAVWIKRDPSFYSNTTSCYLVHSFVIALDSKANMTVKVLYIKWKSGPPKHRIKLTPQTSYLTVIYDSYQRKWKCKTPSLFLLQTFLIEELVSCVLNSISFCCVIKKKQRGSL